MKTLKSLKPAHRYYPLEDAEEAPNDPSPVAGAGTFDAVEVGHVLRAGFMRVVMGVRWSGSFDGRLNAIKGIPLQMPIHINSSLYEN